MSETGGDYIPKKDAEFGPWAHRLLNYVNEKCAGTSPEWTHIPSTARNDLLIQISIWDHAYDTAFETPTKANNEEKRTARIAAKKAVRVFVNDYLRDPPVTDYDRTQIGVTNPKTTRSRVAVIMEPPEIINVISGKGQLITFRFKRQGVEKSQKIPYGHNGAVLYYSYGDKLITDPKELIYSVLMSRSPYKLKKLPPEASGKILSYCVCWENERTEQGHTSSIGNIVIL